jgi:hypothetical protein
VESHGKGVSGQDGSHAKDKDCLKTVERKVGRAGAHLNF